MIKYSKGLELWNNLSELIVFTSTCPSIFMNVLVLYELWIDTVTLVQIPVAYE